jgi:flagellar biosynthesis chaperone FliJ
MRSGALAAALTAAAAVAAPQAPADAPPSPSPADPAAGLQEVNRTLREIAALLREYLERQQIDHLMKRIELQHRSLAPLEDELRRQRAERDGVASEMKALSAHQALMRERLDEEEVQGAAAEQQDDWRMQVRQIEVRLALETEKVGALDQRIADLEADLAGRQAEIRAWEEMLDEAMGLR